MRPKSIPSYCVHKRSGHAYVTIDGRQIPLGAANTPESRSAYDRVLGEWYSNGRRLPQDARQAAAGISSGATIATLVDAFWTHAKAYYTRPALDAAGQTILNSDGTPQREPTEQLEAYHHALRPLLRMYGDMPAATFSCLQLDALRCAMIKPRPDQKTGRVDPGWCRTHANRQIGRIKHAFGWAVIKNLVPVTVHQTLRLLPGLRAGMCEARESDPVKPVDERRALAIVPFVSPQVGAMIQVQLLTGMRSTELCTMRPCDIDRTVTPWVYRPQRHKTQHYGIAREIAIGRRARQILAPFLDRDPNAYLFSPTEAEAHRHEQQRQKRKTKVQPSQVLRAQKAKRRQRGRAPARRYDRDGYYRAIRYGCEAAFNMPKELKWNRHEPVEERHKKETLRSVWHKEHGWHPHQARHRSATDLRKSGGLEVAQIALGHTNQKTTLRYAEANVARAHEVIERVG